MVSKSLSIELSVTQWMLMVILGQIKGEAKDHYEETNAAGWVGVL